MVTLRSALLTAVCLLAGSFSGAAYAQPKTDVVTLANGDRITGEISVLERGQLEFKTDDAGTLYLEWDKLVSLVATSRVFDVVTSDGRRFLGGLDPAPARSILVSGVGGAALPMMDVTHISPIGRSFWRKLDGSISAGFNYTRSSGIAQFNLNSRTTYRRPGFDIHHSASYTATGTEEDDFETDDRGFIQFTYARFVSRRWVVAGLGQFESNESLGLLLRSEGGGVAGPRLVDTNRAQMWFGAGLLANHEEGIDVAPTENLEAVVIWRLSYFTYDRPKTNIDIGFGYLPSLSDPGRQRIEFAATLRRELVKDLMVSVDAYDNYDSRPPNEQFDTNDVGIVLSIGWTY